jgi:hypothetical protein
MPPAVIVLLPTASQIRSDVELRPFSFPKLQMSPVNIAVVF